jgi:hypothetical protein
MAKTKEGVNGVIEKLALISEGVVSILPNAKTVVVFSLNNEDFSFMKTQVDDFSNNTQFKIDISGTEFIFLKDDSWNNVEGNS